MEGDKFKIDDEVRVKISGERGIVIGVAHYKHADTDYRIHYKAGDGRAVSDWFDGNLLELAD